MRWAITTACLIVGVIGVALLAQAQNVDADRLPPGGRSILYIGVVIAWGFAAVGAYAHSRRPENHTGALMVLVGTMIALTALQFFDQTVLFSIGVLLDTICISTLIHLLLAFPTGRVEGRWARAALFAAYVAGCLQLPALFVTECTECARGNPFLIEENDVVATIVGVPQGLLFLFALVTTVVVLLRRRQVATPLQRRALEPVLLLGAVILTLGFASVVSHSADVGPTQALQIDLLRDVRAVARGVPARARPHALLPHGRGRARDRAARAGPARRARCAGHRARRPDARGPVLGGWSLRGPRRPSRRRRRR